MNPTALNGQRVRFLWLMLIDPGLTKSFFSIAALANGGKSWASAFKKAKATVTEMTVEELANVRPEKIIRMIILNEGNPRSPQGL